MAVDKLIRYFEELSVESLARIPEFYSKDVYFKDPFNEVTGLPAVHNIFSHMFQQVNEPRFVITEKVTDAHGAMLVWEFRFRFHSHRKHDAQVIRGVSHLKFDAVGKVNYHRDYWDASEELYMKLPLVGALMRGLRKLLSA